MKTATQTILMLPPEALLPMNIRFNLLKFRVDDLAEKIAEAGKVETNLKVEELAEPGPNGETHGIREGHYRQAAVAKLNKQGAGILLPCEVVEASTGVDRILHQISENLDRQDMTPMDIAVAGRKLIEAGMSKVDIRKRFSRPGGRKGVTMQPISNSQLNIYMSYLDFPKDIQNKIHDGRLRMNAANELAKFPREKWEAILARAEADRVSEIDAEEKQEENYLNSLKKAEEKEAKEKAQAEELQKAEAVAEEASKAADAKLKVATDAYAAAKTVPAKEKEKKAKADEAWKAAENDAKAAQKASEEAAAKAEKIRKQVEERQKAAAERAQKLADARKSGATKSPTGEQVKKAGAKETGNGTTKLNANEMRDVARIVAVQTGFPKAQKIGKALQSCFEGEITDNQFLSELAWIVGDKKEKPKHVKEAAAAKAS